MTVDQRLEALRGEMKAHGVDAYVVSDIDPHQGEYVADRWRTRTWLSGFDGSAGTVVVTQNTAGLWTDSRYFLAAEEAMQGTGIELFREGLPGVPSFMDWIAATLTSGQRVGVDDDVYSVAQFKALDQACARRGISVVAGVELFSKVWSDRPAPPSNHLFLHDEKFAGRSCPEKISDVRRMMLDQDVDVYVTPALDDVAWLFNIRGNDVAYNPVALAYAAVTRSSAILFVDSAKVPAEVRSYLDGSEVEIRGYSDVHGFVGQITSGTIALPPDKVSVRLRNAVCDGVRVVEDSSYVTTLKARKNSTEQECLRATMVRDGVAMERFLYWLEHAVGHERITEVSVAQKLREFRAAGVRFVGESFDTIAGFGPHGAIVHYAADADSDAEIVSPGMLLLDSGAQYADGTTDITRVIPFGTPSEQAVRDYTTVLRAHIALATIRFPAGTSGPQLDTVARGTLWREGVAYGHGTGHGVGFFLNVHEGPQRIGAQPQAVPLVPGMYISNEPGLYRTGEYGIRIENLVLVQESVENQFGRFLEFETVTLCHLEPALIEVALLTDDERRWVNDYQERVFEKIGPQLPETEREWLRNKTARI